MPPYVVGIIGFVASLLLMALKIPIAFVFALVGGIGIIYLGGVRELLPLFESFPYTWASDYVLICIPLFMLMADFVSHSGISQDLFQSAHKWLGRLPGGLAVATMAACTAFAAATGVSVASAATMGAITLPEMKKHGYDMKLATGTVAVGGTLGILIPPSTTMIIYGVLTETSIGKLFMAGIVPGIMLSAIYMLLIVARVRLNPTLGPAGTSSSWKEKIISIRGIWGVGLLFALVIGGIWGGIFTPTEAGAVGAFGSMLIALGRRKLTMGSLRSALDDTVRTSGMILAIIIGAMLFNYFLAITRLPAELAAWVANLPLSRYPILMVILLIYIPLGMFMDALAMLVLTMPIFFPVVISLGFNPVWFGILIIVLYEMALITPPVGLNCYVLAGVAKDVPLEDIFRGIAPFAAVMLLGLAILIAFPQISLWLPSLMR